MAASHITCRDCGLIFTRNLELPDGLGDHGFKHNIDACMTCATSLCARCEYKRYKEVALPIIKDKNLTPEQKDKQLIALGYGTEARGICVVCRSRTRELHYNDNRGYGQEFTLDEADEFLQRILAQVGPDSPKK